MRYYSVFSGVEAATLAWEPLGWEPLVFSEIDEFPSAVLSERFPDVPNLGDITQINWKKAVKSYGRPDLVVGGSPCQSFSVAGTRTGLEGASGLMWEYVRCIRDVKPDWLLWENVPGALSSSHGEDFRCLLAALDALGYGLAWRVLDAQFFGVAQRRERVFLVGCLGDPRPPVEVLFESEGLRWDTPSSREKRKELAAGAGVGAEGPGWALNPADPQSKRVFSPCGAAPTLSSGTGEGMNIQPSVLCDGFRWHQGSGAGSTGCEPEQSPTLDATKPPAVIQLKGNSIDRDTFQNGRTWCDPDENGTYTLNATDVDGVICIPENAINRPTGGTNGPMAYGEGEPSPTLRASKDVPAVMCMTDTQPHSMVDGEVCGALSATMHKDPPVVAKTLKMRGGCEGGGKGPLVQEDVSATLGTGNDQTLFEPVSFAANQRGELRLQGGDGTVVGAVPASQSGKQVQGVLCQYGDVAGAITARNDGSPCPDRGPSVVAQGYVVRRLTPRECERLQGMPDDHTLVPYRGKPAEECPDTPRYKAVGNSMAVPVMRWIGERIAEVDATLPWPDVPYVR